MTLFKLPPNANAQMELRNTTFDLAKGIAVFLMIVIHVIDFYGLPEVRFGAFGTAIKFALGWPAASLFVFVMGIFVGLSKTNDFRAQLTRALSLFALGYLLNFARGTIPMWLSIQIGLVSYEDVAPHTPLTELLVGDVFQFAGIALLICALLKQCTKQVSLWIAFGCAVIFSSYLVWDQYTQSNIINQVLKLFVGNEDAGIMFPVFPWLAYPTFGMALGHYMSLKYRESFNFAQCFKLGFLCAILGLALTLSNPNFHIVTNLRSGPGIVILMTGIVMMFLYLVNKFTQRFKTSGLVTLLAFWGKHVTTLYVIQWLLIGWGLMLVGLQQLTSVETCVSIAVVLFACHYIVYLKHVKTKATGRKRSSDNISSIPAK